MTTRSERKYDYFTFRESDYGGFDVHGFSTYPRNSCLAGQPMKCFLDRFGTMEEVLAKYPKATGGSKWTDPQVSLSHLPGEDDFVSGGAYPDDFDDRR